MKEGKRRFNRLAWFKQLWPRVLWSNYHDADGRRWFAIWTQWLGRVYDHRRFPIAEV